MKSPDWRISHGASEVRLDPGGVTAMVGAGWRARYERVSFGPGFHMNFGHVETDTPMEQVVSEQDDIPQSISVWAPITGRATLTTEDAPELAFKPWRGAMLVAKDRTATFRFPASQTFRFLSVAVSVDLFVALLDGKTPAALRPLVESRGRATVVRERPIKAPTRSLIGELGAPGEAGGALQRLHREAVALRLLTEVMGGQTAGFDAISLTAAEASAIHEAHAALVADLREPPSAAELARSARMGLRRFLQAFETLHGASPDRALRMARLAEARRLLETEELSMKEIAWRVGYSHVSNFVAAFSSHFGQPPRRFSRRVRTARS